jgi:sulfur carrier protein
MLVPPYAALRAKTRYVIRETAGMRKLSLFNRRGQVIEASGMRIQVNGDMTEVPVRTLSELIAHLGLDPRKVAVERNLEIVPRSLHPETELAEGDRIELVQLVGGG